MRCRACNVVLDDEESSLLFSNTTHHIDLCSFCLADTFIFADEIVEENENE
jgi:hypothetical protein